MKQKTIIKVLAVLGLAAIVLGALLPTLTTL